MLKRALAGVVVIVLAAGVAAKEPSPEPPPDGSNTGKLQGTWSLQSLELGGKGGLAAAKGLLMTVKITKTEWVMESNLGMGVGKGATTKYTIKVNNTKKPAWIDKTSGTRTMQGIYELKGDTLKVSSGTAIGGAATRPTSFTDTKGRFVVMTFQRVKAKK